MTSRLNLVSFSLLCVAAMTAACDNTRRSRLARFGDTDSGTGETDSGSPPGDDAGSSPETDAGTSIPEDSGHVGGDDAGPPPPADAGHDRGPIVPSTDNPSASCSVPTGPWGFSEGTMQQPWRVTDCALRPYDLYNNDYCEAAFTVVVHSEPWCGECIADAPTMRSNLIDRYASRGVRVLEVLQEDERGLPIDASTCNAWASAYESEGFVFMDPESEISTYSYRPGIDEEPSGSRSEGLPVVNIYDETGTLVYHHEGSTNDWYDITGALDELL